MKQVFILLILCCPVLSMCQPITISGKVINEEGEPISSATITIKPSLQKISSNAEGKFELRAVRYRDTIIISATGYATEVIAVSSIPRPESEFEIILQRKYSILDQAVVIAYGTTTKRVSTGNVGRVTAPEISNQPVSNPLSALQGRVPGLVVTQSSGLPGASLKIEIRGRGSIAQGTEPLYIIDGVPIAAGTMYINQLTSALTPSNIDAGLSPFNSLNPADIESIEILKDADATAIYGSRGANGVILITTKTGKPGKTKFNANLYSGFSRVTRTMSLLNTPDYLKMRREAFANDGVVPTLATAPDLLVWDTTRYTDFKKLLIGNTANTTDAQASVSGGSATMSFLIGAGYHYESTVYPGSTADKKTSLHFNFSNHSLNKKFSIALTGSFVQDNNNLTGNDLTTYMDLPPNTPPLYDADGKLNWQEGGVSFANPLGRLKFKYRAQTQNLTGNLVSSYNLLNNLVAKLSLGYSDVRLDEKRLYPKAAQDPFSNPKGTAAFANSLFQSWIAEPQLEYSLKISKGKLQLLAGASIQQSITDAVSLSGTGYINDALIESISGAASVTASNSFSEYKYAAVFTRLNYNWMNKYIVNLTGRRDGSSRFGPGNQFANFAAAGAAWNFAAEDYFKRAFKFISFGKLRTSYGAAGNDQIGNYKYLDSWSVTSNPYQGDVGLYPFQLFNPAYGWEVNKKWEASIDLGFFNDNLFISAAYFNNRSSNQLISYPLPTQTGFTDIINNLDATVLNSGWELEASVEKIKLGSLNYSASVNISFPKNKLISFPNLAASSYANSYVIGQPLNLLYAIKYTGIDPATGTYTFEDLNNDNSLNSKDFQFLGGLVAKCYGGFGNKLGYKGWLLDMFLEFRKQQGRSLWVNNVNVPGIMRNEPEIVLDRWTKPGDIATIQRFSTTAANAAYKAATNFNYGLRSDGPYTDASFIRCKNISLSYTIGSQWLKRIHADNCRFYCLAQNLFTITNYTGTDPETQNYTSLPPLKTIAIGFQLTF